MVYRGILDEIGAGRVVESNDFIVVRRFGYWRVKMSVSGPPGKVGAPHPVAALRTPRAGLLRPSTAYVTGGAVRGMFGAPVAALLLGGIATLISWLVLGTIIGKVIGSSGTGALIGFFLGLLTVPYILYTQVRFTYDWARASTTLS
jgi:hypothetical protein